MLISPLLQYSNYAEPHITTQRPGSLVRLYQRTHTNGSLGIGNFVMIRVHRTNIDSDGNNRIKTRKRVRRRKLIQLRRTISEARIINDFMKSRTYRKKPENIIRQMGSTIS
jgi:hypothetical protein